MVIFSVQMNLSDQSRKGGIGYPYRFHIDTVVIILADCLTLVISHVFSFNASIKLTLLLRRWRWHLIIWVLWWLGWWRVLRFLLKMLGRRILLY